MVTKKFEGELKSVEFVGSDFNPFDSETQIMWDDKLFRNIPPKCIIEFGPIRVEEQDSKTKILLKPTRVRYDKEHPNSDLSANDLWDQIMNPLDFDTLLGNKLGLAFQAQKNLKKTLLGQIPISANIIDIGAGVGGDMTKMQVNKVLS